MRRGGQKPCKTPNINSIWLKIVRIGQTTIDLWLSNQLAYSNRDLGCSNSSRQISRLIYNLLRILWRKILLRAKIWHLIQKTCCRRSLWSCIIRLAAEGKITKRPIQVKLIGHPTAPCYSKDNFTRAPQTQLIKRVIIGQRTHLQRYLTIIRIIWVRNRKKTILIIRSASKRWDPSKETKTHNRKVSQTKTEIN